jgi:glycosyltransferase involved in cell wall biosynthesis
MKVEDQLVSVVIPTFNRAYCLGATLASLQQQSYQNWEAIVVDDGSTDDTGATVRTIAAQDPRVKYHYKTNGGVSAARNTGLRIASGEWIGFLDSDDAWEPWKLAAQIACFRQLPEVGMVWTDMNAVDPAGNLVSSRHLRKMYSAYRRVGNREIFSHRCELSSFAPGLVSANQALDGAVVRWGDIYSPMIYGSLVHTSTVLISRQRLRLLELFNESYRTGEDYDFHLRTCREGPVALLDVPCVRYRVAGGADQLSAPSYEVEMALNALRIREAAIARDRARIDLAPGELTQIMAYANCWVAEQLFQRGDFAAARPHFWRSVPLEGRRLRLLLKSVLLYLPPPLIRAISSMRR